jgi:hypothetical protein
MSTKALERRLRKVEAAQFPLDLNVVYPLAWLHDLELEELHEIAERAKALDPDISDYSTIADSPDRERAMALAQLASDRFVRGDPCFDPTGKLSAEAHVRECRIYHQELYPAARDSGQPFDDKALKREARLRAWAEVEAARAKADPAGSCP